MPDNPRPPVPSPSIDRASVDRILARALELQASSSPDPEGRLTEAQLEALGKEVGLDPVNLRQALAEERARVEAPAMERGLVATLYGSSGVSAQRTVRGTLAPVLKALDDWMQREELLIAQRYFTERIVWEARTDFASRFKRAAGGRGHALARATTVGATVVSLDDGRVLVRLDAGALLRKRLPQVHGIEPDLPSERLELRLGEPSLRIVAGTGLQLERARQNPIDRRTVDGRRWHWRARALGHSVS